MADYHSSAQDPAKYWQNESWCSAGGDNTVMNEPANIDMTSQTNFNKYHPFSILKWAQ